MKREIKRRWPPRVLDDTTCPVLLDDEAAAPARPPAAKVSSQ